MNTATIIVLGIIAVLVVAAIAYIALCRRTACTDSCSGCALGAICRTKAKNNS